MEPHLPVAAELPRAARQDEQASGANGMMARRVPKYTEPHGGVTPDDPHWLSWDGGHAEIGIRDPSSERLRERGH